MRRLRSILRHFEFSRRANFNINRSAIVPPQQLQATGKKKKKSIKASRNQSVIKMSLWLVNSEPFDYYSRPSRLLDQRFGMGLEPEDFLSPMVPREFRNLLRSPTGYLRPWRSMSSHKDVGSIVKCDKDKFEANLDVQQFKPEEITVKVSDNVVTIEGKHEEKEDEHGFISRHFVRKYLLPKGHDAERVESKLSSDGVLTITAPKISTNKEEQQRSIPVIQTGQPSKTVEQNEEKKGEKK